MRLDGFRAFFIRDVFHEHVFKSFVDDPLHPHRNQTVDIDGPVSGVRMDSLHRLKGTRYAVERLW